MLDLLDVSTCNGGMDRASDLDHQSTLPLACTLGPEDGLMRLRRWERLHEIGGPVAYLDGRDLEVRYQPSPGVQAELAELAAAEQRCCSFVTWTVAEVEGRPVLRVASPAEVPDAVAPIAAMFGLTVTS